MTAKNRKWNAANRQKYLAHKAVENAVKAGRLFAQPCVVCGTNELVHAHHEDYSKPLDVIWYCPTHHVARHAQIDGGDAPDVSHLIVVAPLFAIRKIQSGATHISWDPRDKVWNVRIMRKDFRYRAKFKSHGDAIIARDEAYKRFAELALGSTAQASLSNLSRVAAINDPTRSFTHTHTDYP